MGAMLTQAGIESVSRLSTLTLFEDVRQQRSVDLSAAVEAVDMPHHRHLLR